MTGETGRERGGGAVRTALPEATASPAPRSPVRGGLNGVTVALLEGRMGGELADLVRRQGGLPLAAAAVREVRLDGTQGVGRLIDGLADGSADVVVFLTGAGADTLFAEAERIGRLEELCDGLAAATVVCRGHKPRAVLRRRELPVSALVAEPYTTAEVIETLAALQPGGRGVAIVHYGERNPALGDALRQWGSRVLDVCLYEWALPEDTSALEALIELIVGGEVAALACTSQVQVRHLFSVAAGTGRILKLIHALNTHVVVAAVGPTCAEALKAAGVTPAVVPTHPKMGPMIVALAEHFAARDDRPAAAAIASGESLAEMVSRFEKGLIESALRVTRGNRARAAKLLRTTERIVGYRVQQYGIDWRAYRD